MITKADIERIKSTIPIGLKGEFGKRAPYDNTAERSRKILENLARKKLDSDRL